MLRYSTTSARVFAILLVAASASAQDLDLATNGAEVRWRGTAVGAQAGTYLDHGTMGTDSRRDLIVGAPGRGSAAKGHVYIIFGGPVPSPGEHSLSSANVVFTGAVNGDGFGTAGAAGNVLNLENTNPRNLLVGAPDADGGRGMLYLFTTNFVGGESLTTAAASMTVRGAPNDHLGSAVATADLDADGYREIIVGAPGNSRVYVIWGGPGLAGQARDMAATDATGPDITITGVGIGSVLTAGAFTGDSVYDLFIGAPSVHLVYMIQGLGTRAYPRNMIVQRDETAYFLGVNGDSAGASLRMGDFDGDNRTDLLIGAPTAGPSSRGAAYVLWGKKPGEATPGSLWLTQADVTFLGPVANARLGEMVASGNINRDTDEDAAIVAPGASAGGSVYVYYGRERAAYGTASAAGRVVDFADPSQRSLRVLGDPAAGAIATVFVYEVTGEGARDLMVGTPQATTSAGATSGRIYFAISPKMALSSYSVTATAVQGATAQRSVSVTNGSPTTITYSAASLTSWLTVSPTFGSAVESAPGNLTVGVSGVGLAPGDYTGQFQVTSTSEHLEMTLPAEVLLTVITQPTLSANTTFPATVGTPITWTAASTGGAAGVLYQFFRLDADGWHMVRDWGASPTYSWTPPVNAAGEHAVQVWVKTPSSTSLYDAYAATPVFRIERAVPRITSFTNTGTYPLAPNTPVQFNVTATGGTAALEYRFVLYREGVGWSVLQEYGSASQAMWTPTVSGSYSVQVWVRSTGVSDLYEAWSSSGVLTVSTTAPVTVHSLSADKPFPIKAGETVTFTATASGGSAGPLQFQFVRYDESSGSWTIVQPYSSSRTYAWATGASSLGNHVVQVWVRSMGSSAVYQAWGTSGMFPVVMEPLSSPSLSASVVFPVPSPTPVKWTVHVTGGIAPLQYQFWLYTQGQGWTMARDWGTSNSFTWTPPGNGTYVMQAYVRHAGSAAQYDAWATSGFFQLAGGAPAQAVSITADRAFPVTAGQAITWTGMATRGTAGPLQYRFILLNQGTGAWSVLQEYSTANTVTWTTAPNNQGTYLIQMWVRSAGSSAQYEGWISTGSFTIQ